MPITAIAELSLCGMACSSSLVPPCQLLLLAGPEHGRTIPLPEGHMASHIERRKFLATLGGAVASWPLAARAQQTGKVYRIGFLANDPAIPMQSAGQAFLDGLREGGFIEGGNIIIERRFAEARPDRYAKLVAELIQLDVDVLEHLFEAS